MNADKDEQRTGGSAAGQRPPVSMAVRMLKASKANTKGITHVLHQFEDVEAICKTVGGKKNINNTDDGARKMRPGDGRSTYGNVSESGSLPDALRLSMT